MPAVPGTNGDPDLILTGAAGSMPTRSLLAVEFVCSFSRAAKENPPRALAWEESCCLHQLQRLSLREAELLRLEEDLKLRADELDRREDALTEREAQVERGQQVFMTHVEAWLRNKDAEAEARVANAKDALVKDYR